MMRNRNIGFAVPGDITTLTGGYIYDRKLSDALAASGVAVRHLEFGDSFPHPTTPDMDSAFAQLATLPCDCPVIIDGLAFGALDTARLSELRTPLVPLVHHPLACETGLDPALARRMATREIANLALARHILVTSPYIARLLTRDYNVAPSRITAAPPGFDPPGREDRRVKKTPPLILSVGLLAQRKGHDILLRALSRIVDLEWQAVIVGRAHEPETVSALNELHKALGLAQRVRFAGAVPQATLDQLYSEASLFALATRYEGYGIVFGEAMRHALPIISTTAGAVPDTVPTSAGLLVPTDDMEGFADALRHLLCNTDLRSRYAKAARLAAERLPSWPETARRVVAVLDRKCGDANAP